LISRINLLSRLKMVSDPRREIVYNLPQLLVSIAPQKHIFLEWGRGSGKSTILADRIVKLVKSMPRASFFIVGKTFQQMLTRTLPSTFAALELLGYKKGLHYFVGQAPPKSFNYATPFEPPGNFKYAMYWCNGCVFHLISQDREGNGRGLNTSGGVGDEMQMLDYIKLFGDVLATNRANKSLYQHLPLWCSTMFAGTVPIGMDGQWLYKMEKEAIKKPSEILYLRASAEENRDNLPDSWFEDQKRILPDIIYNAEILNIRPNQVLGGFYRSLTEKHLYTKFNYSHLDSFDYSVDALKATDCRQDNDFISDQPFDVALDYGSNFNCIVTAQQVADEYRFVSSFYVKAPQRTRDAVNKFCEYYRFKKDKTVYYWHDQTSLPGTGLSPFNYMEEVMTTFEANGWKVISMYIGKAPNHELKFNLWDNMLKETDERLPPVRFNAEHCKYLLISMQYAPTKESHKGIEKDKSSEGADIEQEEATHLSDAADTIIFGKYGVNISHKGGFQNIPTPQIRNI